MAIIPSNYCHMKSSATPLVQCYFVQSQSHIRCSYTNTANCQRKVTYLGMYTSTFDKLEGHGVPPVIEYTAAYIRMHVMQEAAHTYNNIRRYA